MPVDAELVRRKLRLILEDLARLGPLATLALDAYLADQDHELVAERLLERAIGRMIDVNYHLCVESGGLPPTDYHASFLRLADLGVLPRDRAEALARASGLRNRLAHEYNGLDERLVHAAARAAVADVPEYLRAVERHLEALERA
jgi:uncharacterized protein YutE (UPF0331/DUF86 family)